MPTSVPSCGTVPFQSEVCLHCSSRGNGSHHAQVFQAFHFLSAEYRSGAGSGDEAPLRLRAFAESPFSIACRNACLSTLSASSIRVSRWLASASFSAALYCLPQTRSSDMKHFDAQRCVCDGKQRKY